jgi:hypothetical protein
MTVWCMCIVYWIPKATNTLIVCNTYCFSHRNKHATVLWLLTLPVLISVIKFVSDTIGYRRKWVAPGPTLSCLRSFSQCCFIIILCVALVVTIKVYCPQSTFKCWRYGIQDHTIFKNHEYYMISEHEEFDWLIDWLIDYDWVRDLMVPMHLGAWGVFTYSRVLFWCQVTNLILYSLPLSFVLPECN